MVRDVTDLVELRVRALAHGGDAIAHPEQAETRETWFVEGAIPGELVRVEALDANAKRRRGRVVEVVEPAAERVEPPCPHAEGCGGCQWQHIDPEHQAEHKAEIVRGQLRRLPVEVKRVIPSPAHAGYRRRARLHYEVQDGKISLGFFGARSRSVVDVDRCLVLHPVLDAAFQKLREIVEVLPEKGEVHGLTDGTRVVLGLGGVAPSSVRMAAAEDLLDDVLVGITLRGGRSRATAGVAALAIDGDGGRLPIAATPFVFAQAQAEQNEALVQHVAKATASEGHKVLELFCGGGNLTRALAEGAAGVWAVDDDREAIGRLREMIQATDLKVRARRGASQTELQRYARQGRKFDVVVVDPPRAGLGKEASKIVAKITRTRVVYVSCDPATLARDLEVLLSEGFRAVDVRIFDMMPMTAEVEIVAVLNRDREPAPHAD
jgi:23S rRNA (uracil1939-C5)-methyltransferase